MAQRGKTKIVLDADVVIHFAKGGLLSKLPAIFPNYEYIILETVHQELLSEIRIQVDNQISLLKNIKSEPFKPTGEMMREYAVLSRQYGKGESACMAYCLFNHDVIGSSNLRDIREYCEKKQITYLTTMDFLWHAWQKKIITTQEANTFISDVRQKGSKLPDIDIEKYICERQI